MTLRAVRQEALYRVEALLTTAAAGKASGHGVPVELIEAQAGALEMPLVIASFDAPPSNAEYEEGLAEALAPLQREGLRTVLAGDLFLEDIRAYREQQFQALGMEAAFPLWQRDTQALAETFIAEGYEAVVCSVDTDQLDASFAGRRYDEALLADLPAEVDPCGEHGAFHTFVCDGPLFQAPVSLRMEGSRRDGRMCFARLVKGA